MYRILINMFFVFCFFPFIELIPLGTDNQPIAAIIGSFIVFINLLRTKKVPSIFFQFFFIFIFALCILFFSDINFTSLRSLMNYYSLFVIPYATYISLVYLKKFPFNFFKVCIWTYFFVGLIQLLFDPSFLTFLLPRGDSNLTLISGRGVVCLAPEPTFYGFLCLLFLIILWLYKEHISKLQFYTLNIIILIQIFVFSRSSASIVLLVISFFIYLAYLQFKSGNIALLVSVLILSIMFLFVIIPLMLPYFSNYRIGVLLTIMYENPMNFMFVDSSMNERFNSIYFSILGFIENFGIPHGYNAYGSYFMDKKYDPNYSMFFADYMYRSRDMPTRIMSGFGSILFELGFIGLYYIYIVGKRMYFIIQAKLSYMFIASLLFLIILNALTFTNALLGFTIGIILYLSLQLKEFKL